MFLFYITIDNNNNSNSNKNNNNNNNMHKHNHSHDHNHSHKNNNMLFELTFITFFITWLCEFTFTKMNLFFLYVFNAIQYTYIMHGNYNK